MLKKPLLVLGVVAGFTVIGRAQSVTPDVLATAGDFYLQSVGSISWTLGEPMGETYMQTNNHITQGFQQPWDFGTGVAAAPTPVNADAYPNPTNDVVNLQFGDNASGLYVIEVFNTLGQRLSASQFAAGPSARTTVSLSDYADGIYFVTVRKIDTNEASTFKITKNS
jgi:hypothetical protein